MKTLWQTPVLPRAPVVMQTIRPAGLMSAFSRTFSQALPTPFILLHPVLPTPCSSRRSFQLSPSFPSKMERDQTSSTHFWKEHCPGKVKKSGSFSEGSKLPLALLQANHFTFSRARLSIGKVRTLSYIFSKILLSSKNSVIIPRILIGEV